MINVISKTQRCFFLRERIHSKIKCTNNSTLVKPELFVNQNSKMPTLKRQDNSFTISFFGAVFCVDKRTQVFFYISSVFLNSTSWVIFILNLESVFRLNNKKVTLFSFCSRKTHTHKHTQNDSLHSLFSSIIFFSFHTKEMIRQISLL